MGDQLRVGGRGRLGGGGAVTWSVAEGLRGRRWRASLSDGDVLRAVVLLELGISGRPAKLELGTPVGLLTVHPEPGGVLHGNVVTADGVTPIAIPFGADAALDVDGLPIGAAAACHRLAAGIGVGEGVDVPVVRIGLDLSARAEIATVRRETADEWTFGGAHVRVDRRGVLVLDEEREWPLEAGAGGD